MCFMKRIALLGMLAGIMAFTACEKPLPAEGEQPEADFEYAINDETLEVVFTNKSQKAKNYRWEFGDELHGVSKEENPVYIYNASGLYEVTLTAYNGDFSHSVTRTLPVQKIPEADFSYNVDGYTGKVTFTNKSTDAASYKWDFGDHKGTSTEKDPVYVYEASGSYEVSLTAITGDLESVKKQTVEVTVIAPEADFEFSADNNTGKVTFINKSTNAASYKWEFGDELNGTSEEENPVYTYRKPGTYTVKLTASSGSKSAEAVKEVTLTVPAGAAFICIVPDGKPDDWADIPALDGDWGQPVSATTMSWGTEITEVKTAMTKDYLYVLLKGTEKIKAANLAEVKIFLDLDNNIETGEKMSPWVQDNVMGGDVMFYQGTPWQYVTDGYKGDKNFPVQYVFSDGNDGSVYYKELSICMSDIKKHYQSGGNGVSLNVSDTIKMVITMNTGAWRPVGTPESGDDLTLNKLPYISVETKYVEWK